jgi:hypothetical protein
LERQMGKQRTVGTNMARARVYSISLPKVSILRSIIMYRVLGRKINTILSILSHFNALIFFFACVYSFTDQALSMALMYDISKTKK